MGNGQGVCLFTQLLPCVVNHHSNHTLNSPSTIYSCTIYNKNLISVSKFAKDHYVIFEFHPTFCFLKSQGSSRVLLRGTIEEDDLYKFDNIQTLSKIFGSFKSPSVVSHTHFRPSRLVPLFCFFYFNYQNSCTLSNAFYLSSLIFLFFVFFLFPFSPWKLHSLQCLGENDNNNVTRIERRTVM